MVLRSFRWVLIGLGLSAGLVVACATDETPKDDAQCTTGTAGCDCYPNGTCNAPLVCNASRARCEAASGQGGISGNAGSGTGGGDGGNTSSGGASAGSESTGGSQGGTGNAGSSQGGTGNATTGGSDAGGGTGGSTTTGGNAGAGAGDGGSGNGGAGMGGMSGGSAGSSAGSGGSAGMCGDTSSDWQNCGACGRRCRNPGNRCPVVACCVGGACEPSYGECFDSSAGFTTCDEYCMSIGETCVAAGCGSGYTRLSWAAADTANCQAVTQNDGSNTGPCSTRIPFETSTVRNIRCCCTDAP